MLNATYTPKLVGIFFFISWFNLLLNVFRSAYTHENTDHKDRVGDSIQIVHILKQIRSQGLYKPYKYSIYWTYMIYIMNEQNDNWSF